MLVAFLFVVVISRILYQYRLAGDHGVRPTNREATPIAKFSSALIIVSFAGVFALSLQEIFQNDHSHFINTGFRYALGVFVCVFGISLSSYSQYAMGENWRIGVDEKENTELVTTGIFGYVRNPIYTGVVLFFIGQYALIPHVLMGVLVVMCIFSIHLHVRYIEEPHLRRIHGKDFDRYQESTGMYLPRLAV